MSRTGRDLLAERKRLDIRQSDFAKAANLNQTVISAVENVSLILPESEIDRLWNVLHAMTPGKRAVQDAA